jgi:hypothetical protein
MGAITYACKIVIKKPEGERQLGRCKHRLEDNIIIDLKELRCEDLDWIHLAQGRDRGQTCEQDNEPLGLIKAGNFLTS